MIKIENIVTPNGAQWEAVVRAMRNPLNSWGKSDSKWEWVEDPSIINPDDPGMRFVIGKADLDLMRRLAKAGSDHRKYLRMLPVWMDVTAPLYWWKEADTYKVGTVANSCSTMHKIHAKEFALDDFSMSHSRASQSLLFGMKPHLATTIEILNKAREGFLKTDNKEYWWFMIENLPSSYNQRRTLFLNYEVLWNIYNARKEHKLNEWRDFCVTVIREIPYFAEIFLIGAAEND